MFIVRSFLYLILVAVVAQMVTFEGFNQLTSAQYSEHSMTEYLQSSLLFVGFIMFYYASKLNDELKVAMKLVTALLAMMFVREFDAVLDTYMFDGAWQGLVLLIIASTLISLRGEFKQIYASLKAYSLQPSFGSLLTGMLVVLAFSRLLGRGVFWQAVMGDNYVRVVKNIVEEGVETLGYTLVLIAATEVLVFCFASQKQLAAEQRRAALYNRLHV
ncbi:hypothetical protein [Marinomonas epiphytica]